VTALAVALGAVSWSYFTNYWFPWLTIAGVVALINARHLLYSAAVAPYLTATSRRERAVMAHFLTDETFALSLAHFRRIGRFDAPGYWVAALVIFVPWTLGSTVGYLAGGAVDTRLLGLDVAFPAAMAGLSLGMVSRRRDVAAALPSFITAAPRVPGPMDAEAPAGPENAAEANGAVESGSGDNAFEPSGDPRFPGRVRRRRLRSPYGFHPSANQDEEGEGPVPPSDDAPVSD